MPEEDKLNLMIRVNKEDNDYFKVIQKEYKKREYQFLIFLMKF